MKAYLISAVKNGVLTAVYVCTQESLAKEAYRFMLTTSEGTKVDIAACDFDCCVTLLSEGEEPKWAINAAINPKGGVH